MKNEINRRGHWLASAMLNGPSRKEQNPAPGPLFGSKRKYSTEQMRRSNSPEIENGKKVCKYR